MPSGERVEIHTTAKCLANQERVVIRVGSETATVTAGEWSRLISKPKRVEVALYPNGIDDLIS